MKAGSGFIIDTTTNKTDIIQHILTSPSTRVTYIPTQSIGGYLFNIDYDPVNGFYECDTTMREPNNDIFRSSTRMIMKIIITSSTNQRITIPISTPYNSKIIQTSTIQEAISEVRTQKDIYKRSLDIFLEPICPAIFNVFASSNQDDIRYIQYFATTNSVINDINTYCDRDRTNYGVVYALMEIPNYDNAPPKTVSTMFPTYNENAPIPTINTNLEVQLMDSFMYEIYRLWKLGYIHGDLHLDNALYIHNQNLKYIKRNKYRVYIIDFGKTTKRSLDNDNVDYFLANFSRTDWWSYLFVHSYVNSNFRTKIENIKINRKIGKSEFYYWLTQNQDTFIRYTTSLDSTVGSSFDIQLQNFISIVQLLHNLNVDYDPGQRVYVLAFYIRFDNRFYTIPQSLRAQVVNAEVSNIKQIREQIPNRNFERINVNTLNTKKICTWIFVVDQDNILNMYIIQTKSRLEAGTKHIDLVNATNPKYIISAGELLCDPESNSWIYNLASGTFIHRRYVQTNKNAEYRAIQEISYLFMKIFIANYIEPADDMGKSFIDSVHFLENDEVNYLLNIGYGYRFDSELDVEAAMVGGGRTRGGGKTNKSMSMSSISLPDESVSKIEKYFKKNIDINNINKMLKNFKYHSIEEYKKTYENSEMYLTEQKQPQPELISVKLDSLNFDYFAESQVGNKNPFDNDKHNIYNKVSNIMQQLISNQNDDVVINNTYGFSRKQSSQKKSRKRNKKSKNTTQKNTE
jgi:hypothetical protein